MAIASGRNDAIGIARTSLPFARLSEKSICVDRQRLVAYLGLGLIYRLVLDWSFLFPLQDYSSGVYDYALSPNFEKWLLSIVVTILLLLALPRRDGASSLVVQLALFYIVIPMASVFALRDDSTFYFLLVSVTFLIAETVVAHVGAPSRKPPALPDRIRRSLNGLIMAALAAITAFFFLAMLVTEGLPGLTAFNLNDIYLVRAANDMPPFLLSLMSPLAKAIIPFFLAVAVLKKRYGLAAGAFLLEILVFLWTGHKSFFFIIAIVMVVVLLYKPERNFLICLLLTVLVAASSLLYYVSLLPGLDQLGWPFTLFVRRAIYVPATLKFFYFDYFKDMDQPLNFLGTMLSPFAFGPDPVTNYEHEIGGIYTGTFSVYANTGMYGEEVASFGVVGVVLASTFFCVFALIVGFSAWRNGDRYALAVALPFLLNFSNASAVKTMLHAYGAMVIVLLAVYQFENHRNVRSGTSNVDSFNKRE